VVSGVPAGTGFSVQIQRSILDGSHELNRSRFALEPSGFDALKFSVSKWYDLTKSNGVEIGLSCNKNVQSLE
jgi:hypothetical protein